MPIVITKSYMFYLSCGLESDFGK